MGLTWRQRASWLAHLYKAAARQHHRELAPMLRRFIPADAVVLDVGAHAGQFAKLFARMAPRGQVIALEPSAYARSILVPALAVNGIANVEVLAVGLSDRPGEATLHTPLKRSSALGFGTAHLGGETARAVSQAVRLSTLDDLAATLAIERLDFIKADIEGWEMRALVGGENTIRRFRPTLFLEVDDALMLRAGDTPAALFRWLSGAGYEGFTVPALSPAPHWTGAGDYLFIPAESP